MDQDIMEHCKREFADEVMLYTPQWGCWWGVWEGELLIAHALADSGLPDEWCEPYYIT